MSLDFEAAIDAAIGEIEIPWCDEAPSSGERILAECLEIGKEKTASLKGLPNPMEKDLSRHDRSVHSSPRSTLTWKDHWSSESTSPEAPNLRQETLSDSWMPRVPCRSLSDPSPVMKTPVRVPAASAALHQWRSLPASPIRAFHLDEDEQDVQGPKTPERWETLMWGNHSPRTTSWSRTSSIVCPLIIGDEFHPVPTVGDDSWSVTSSSNMRGERLQQNRVQCINALSEELDTLKSSAKRAMYLGRKVERYAAAEVLQLSTDKEILEGRIQKFVEMNRAVEQQLLYLREENQKLEQARQADGIAKANLEKERENLLITVRDEKQKRERMQKDKDSLLSAVLEDRMKLTAAREAMQTTLRNAKKRVEVAEKARDAAVKSLENEKQKIDIERDAMLMAMRDLRTRLEFERDANMSSMRRSSMDVCLANMNSGDRRKSMRVSEKWKQ